jgi:hypothetical protein
MYMDHGDVAFLMSQQEFILGDAAMRGSIKKQNHPKQKPASEGQPRVLHPWSLGCTGSISCGIVLIGHTLQSRSR